MVKSWREARRGQDKALGGSEDLFSEPSKAKNWGQVNIGVECIYTIMKWFAAAAGAHIHRGRYSHKYKVRPDAQIGMSSCSKR